MLADTGVDRKSRNLAQQALLLPVYLPASQWRVTYSPKARLSACSSLAAPVTFLSPQHHKAHPHFFIKDREGWQFQCHCFEDFVLFSISSSRIYTYIRQRWTRYGTSVSFLTSFMHDRKNQTMETAQKRWCCFQQHLKKTWNKNIWDFTVEGVERVETIFSFCILSHLCFYNQSQKKETFFS